MPNRLILESSPYLRQHADNPVDWHAWGEEAFGLAREKDRPIHLSVGYAACHWCHVMAHESFENPVVAQLLNEHFINIKVDRQERPDVDEVYQKVVQMLGQGGGWPLTVFMTPNGEPFFGGTYFPPRDAHGRPGFHALLQALSHAWKNERASLLGNVAQFLEGYRVLDSRLLSGKFDNEQDLPVKAARFFAENTDEHHGGLGGAPKFPNTSCYDLLLRVHQRTSDASLLRAADMTLGNMARGGIYDHLGGGFARYSVDEFWAVPHFEKMLYDNGQLIKLYADAYRISAKPAWRRVIDETIEYVLRDLSHPDGGFFSSEDADSEGEEGKFYVWTPAQIHAALGAEDGALFCRAYGVTEHGNFEHQATVLHRVPEVMVDEEHLLQLRRELLRVRSARVRPGRDENIIASWNGLMIEGLCAAYQATGNQDYLDAACRAADFIQTHMRTEDSGVFRVWNQGQRTEGAAQVGKATVPGFLDDYASMANALLDLYESAFDKRYLDWALALTDQIIERFWDEGLYYTAKGGQALVHRPRAPFDHAVPSGMSTSAFVFLRCHELTGKQAHFERAQQLFEQFGAAAAKNPFGFAHFIAAMDFAQCGPTSIVLAGDRTSALPLVRTVHRAYLPARVIAFAEDVPIGGGREPIDGASAAYVCRRNVCGPPATTEAALVQQLAA
ncbi:MAG TPA: thioredoxin domain-containing protein [Polyangiaceae bacterium]